MSGWAGGVYDLGYHVVWCPKYRRAVLVGQVRDRLDTLIQQKCAEHGWPIVALEIEPDQVHNAALQERRDAYAHPSKTKVRYGDQSAQLKEIRAYDPDLARWSFSSQQATLRRLNLAFEAFFRRVKAGETPGYPRFKGAGWFDTVTWPVDNDGCRWDSQPEHPTRTFVRLQGVRHVRVHQHRPVRGRVKTLSVKRESARWYLILSCDDVPSKPLPPTGAVVGIDLGVASLVTDSNGEHYGNPRFLRRSADRLADAQRDLSRKRRGSKRRRMAVQRVAVLSRQVARQRVDLANKTVNEIVADHDLIVVEKLNIKGMVKRARPRPDPDSAGGFLPNGQAAKSGLNKSIHDAGWGVFLNVLRAKAESAGRLVVEVNPRHTSQRCPGCGHVAAENRLTQATFLCVRCGHAAHADVNAAVNILRAGLALQAATPSS
ncbi:RNA-guided endonuclease TnpB family protein [Frankia sp. AiPa1]|uniref:RNA-guided endonuclease TnpB family protein n=1 Tax=Frankia sp. AiPa1 TaxID=573492 RepID=UPI00202ADCE5|nr:RNA-guided endonuclease TnpB family protein [Frankia sp. AiPa1]MCL9760917.1 RNA-guided endonuclease TnpB family protein [Frankia sp. AiPa1]